MQMRRVCGVMAAQQGGGGKFEGLARLHGANYRAGCQGVDLIHAEGGHGDQRLIPGLKIGFGEQVDGFVHAIGEQHLPGGDSEMLGDGALAGLALRIFVQRLGGDGVQGLEDARRAAIHVFVEVEAQSVAAAQRRVILLQNFDGAAGAQQCSCGSFLQPHAHACGVALQSLGFGQQE